MEAEASPALQAGSSSSPLSGAQSPSSSSQAKGELQVELDETVSERRAMERRIESLRNELEFCECQLQSLMQQESRLKSEMGIAIERERLPSVGDFCDPNSKPAGPVLFEMEADADSDPGQNAADSDGGLEHEEMPCDGENVADWEDGLETIGVAKCRLCGFKFPLDVEAIEKHTKECNKAHEDETVGELLGKCHACGALLPLNTEEIELHLSVCEKKLAPPVPSVPIPGQSTSDKRTASPAKRTSLWTFLLPMRHRCNDRCAEATHSASSRGYGR